MTRRPSSATTPHANSHRSIRSRRARPAIAFLVAALLALAGCSSGSSSDASSSSSTTTPDSIETPIHVDPAVPITTVIGKEFDIMLPADPGSGWRWALAPIDNSRLIALGSRFSDDPNLLSRAESATTTTTSTVARFTTTTAIDATTTTSSPAVLPLVQIISFAGRSVGPAVLTFQYTQIAGTTATQNQVVTFNVQVIAAPPATSSTLSPSTTTR